MGACVDSMFLQKRNSLAILPHKWVRELPDAVTAEMRCLQPVAALPLHSHDLEDARSLVEGVGSL